MGGKGNSRYFWLIFCEELRHAAMHTKGFPYAKLCLVLDKNYGH